MIIVRSVEVTDAILTSTDVPEADESEFDIGTTYVSIGEKVMVTTSGVHEIFVNLTTSNLGNQPEDDDPVTPVNWARESATNRWAMFSDQISDQTEQVTSFEVELTPGSLVNAISFFGIDATTIQVVMDDPVEGEVYNRIVNLVDDSGVNNWYEFYFEPISLQNTLSLVDLPPFLNAVITVTVTKAGGTAKLGLLTMGAQKRLGDTDYGTSIGIIDYSTKERDTFGEPVIVKRNFSKRANYLVTVDTVNIDSVQRILSDFRTTPLTFIGSVDFPSTILYGFYKDFSEVSRHTKSVLNIEVEGLAQ